MPQIWSHWKLVIDVVLNTCNCRYLAVLSSIIVVQFLMFSKVSVLEAQISHFTIDE